MPSLSSSRLETAFDCSVESVIVGTLLPFPALHAEPGDCDRRRQEWNHGRRDRCALAEPATDAAALIAQSSHPMLGIDRAAAAQSADPLAVGEREQHREGHADG